MNDGITKVDVFTGGKEGHAVFRIPAIIMSKKGTLLAFCEGRKRIADMSENIIVFKRSTDGGATWEPLRVIARMGRDSLNNPTAVVVRETGRVVLFFQRYPYPSNEHRTMPGYVTRGFKAMLGYRALLSYETRSDDDGGTWSEPRDITRQVKRPAEVTTIASGPGIGIQLRRGLHAGRLLMPINQGPYGRWRVYVAYSDDRGETWVMGDFAPESGTGHANEVQLVELADGTVMLNARNQGGNNAHARKIATSANGGETWSTLVDDPALIEPTCQGSIVRHSDPLDHEKSVLLFSNPASRTARVCGTVRASFDEGKTWPMTRVIEPGNFAYSCLAVLGDKSIVCLYETGTAGGYEKIVLARFTMPFN
nr:sialidase family protein [Candidatus Sigynarchaeota archaeon]